MGFFQTNWRNQATKNCPPELRGVSFLDWLASLVSGLQVAMDNNAAWESDLRLRAKFNSQKMVMQAALNTIFATTGIIVETQTSVATFNYSYNEGEGIEPIFTYNEDEVKPTYIYNESEPVDTYDFIVKVPMAFYSPEIDRRVRAEVTKLKLGGKLFNVISY